MDFSLLYFFIPVFFVVSITPGLCMTLALTMGMSIGLGNTMKMMVGELSGVLLVATVVVVGGGGLMAANPMLLVVFKYVGGAYLLFVGLQMMRSRGAMAVKPDGSVSFDLDFFSLAGQGFITAVANPKGWAFFLAMTPGFINYDVDLGPQMTALVSIILIIEFTSLMLYAAGGQVLGKLLLNSDNVLLLNRVAGALMMCVGIWLATS
ncbi:MAG: LysE family translocator [Pseudomonadales bacterium]|mgnify:FL=1|jgi:threonine/homoserine/homoserine lactone efflux protein|nr:LysE family translocator [Pseudomonadales bacterium]